MLAKTISIILIMISAAVSYFAQEKSNVSETSKDETAIRQIVKQVEDGWNAKSGKDFAAPFAENADYVVVNGMYIKGRAAIEKGHQQIFDTFYKDSRLAGTIKSIRFVRSDVAIVHVEWNLTFRYNGKEEKSLAMNTMFMTKENGKWQIAAFHNTPIQTESR